MSSDQGPRTAGMRASASDAGGRSLRPRFTAGRTRGRVMSSDQGPRTAGMRASAIECKGRSLNLLLTAENKEALS
jgi:hypothetical protein